MYKIAFHAAAYKHVPLVELGILCKELKIILYLQETYVKLLENQILKSLILISTDKAVRPKNIMGVSKRISELILKSYSSVKKNKTIYSMVRFGNVLASSGSVVPLFKKQIEIGGTYYINSSRYNKILYDHS